ncbi:hypothetical protein HDU98_009414 [Podochytrium sp. JEL0797]|nr:hypothetical protein HDU98_009414 [Podochytrium sp. JEL0797]
MPILDSHIALPLAGFTALHFATAKALARYTTIPPSLLHITAEKLPSTLNALVASTTALHVFFHHAHYATSWTQRPYPQPLDTAFATHAAFTLYDIVVMLSDPETSHITSWAHHVFGLAGTCAIRGYKRGEFFPAAFLPAEMTTVVSNALWLVQRFDAENKRLVTVLMVLRCLAFTVFRLPAGPWCLWHAIHTSRKVEVQEDEDGKKSLPAPAASQGTLSQKFRAFMIEFSKLPLVVKLGSACNVALFTGLNTYWSFLTYRALWRHLQKGKRRMLTSKGDVHHI